MSSFLTQMEIGVPNVFPSNVPERICARSASLRGVTMDDFVAMLQRATLDKPVVNKTGLAGKYDFDLKFAQDESVYGGELPTAPENSDSPHLFAPSNTVIQHVALPQELQPAPLLTETPTSALYIPLLHSSKDANSILGVLIIGVKYVCCVDSYVAHSIHTAPTDA